MYKLSAGHEDSQQCAYGVQTISKLQNPRKLVSDESLSKSRGRVSRSVKESVCALDATWFAASAGKIALVLMEDE